MEIRILILGHIIPLASQQTQSQTGGKDVVYAKAASQRSVASVDFAKTNPRMVDGGSAVY